MYVSYAAIKTLTLQPPWSILNRCKRHILCCKYHRYASPCSRDACHLICRNYPNYNFGSASTATNVALGINDTAATATTLCPATPPLSLPRCCRRESQRRHCVQRCYQRFFRCICLPLRLCCYEPPAQQRLPLLPPLLLQLGTLISVPAASAAQLVAKIFSKLPWYLRYSRSRCAEERGYGFYVCNRCYMKQPKFWS